MATNLHGLAALNQRMSALSRDVATKLGQSANRAGATVIAKAAKAAAPVGPTPEGATVTRKLKSGKVRTSKHAKIVNNIKVKKSRAVSSTMVQNTITVGKAFQAVFVEFGSIHNAPQPFLQNAYEQNKQGVIDAIAKNLGKALTKKGA